MGLNDILLKFEKKTAWTLFGFILAIVCAGFAVYTTYFMDTNPKLNFVIEANTKVLDVKENVKKLEIIYEGENIKQNNKNLSIFKIRIVNPSRVNILNSFYDLNDSVGLKLENAEIVEKPEIVESSSDYLKRNVSFSVDSIGKIRFKPVIIEKGEYFVIKILLLHKQNETPILKTFGKIAGIKDFKVIESYKVNEKKSFWADVIQGDFTVHLARSGIYLLIFILSTVGIIIPLSSLTDYLSLRNKKRIVRKYKSIANVSDNPENNLVYTFYLDHDIDYLNRVQQVLSDEKLLNNKYRNYLKIAKRQVVVDPSTQIYRDRILNPDISEYVRVNSYSTRKILERLHENKIIQFENNVLIVNKEFVDSLNNFISYVKLK